MVNSEFRSTAERIDAKWLSENRLAIQANDPRCAWMFTNSASTLGWEVNRLASFSDDQGRDQLIHFTDYLDWLSEMNIYQELESLLDSVGLTNQEIQMVITAKRLPSQSTAKDRYGVSHVLPREVETKLDLLKGAWAPASTRLIESARSLCPTDTASFRERLAMVNNEPNSTILPVNILNLQRLLDISDGIQVRMMKVTVADPPCGTEAEFRAPERSDCGAIDPETTQPVPYRERSSVVIRSMKDSDSTPGVGTVESQQPVVTEETDRVGHRPVESAGVRFQVSAAIERLDLGRGLCDVNEVIDFLRNTPKIYVTVERLADMFTRLQGYELIDDRWIAIYDSVKGGRAPLIDQLARKLVSIWGGVSVALVHAQLARNNPWFKRVPTSVIEMRLAHAEWASVRNHKVSTAGIAVLNPMHELERLEHLVWSVYHRKPWPTGTDDIVEFTKGFSVGRRKDFESMARDSVIFTRIEGKTAVLRSNDALLRTIVANAPFVEPVGTDRAGRESENLTEEPTVAPPNGMVTPAPQPLVILTGEDVDILEDPPVDAIEASVEEIDDAATDLMQPDSLEKEVHFGSTSTSTRTVRQLLEQIAEGTLVIPGIQRGYVWKATQVRDLMDSLYRGYPVGTMLIWDTDQHLPVRSLGTTDWKNPKTVVKQSLLLDGQQRLTSLYFALVTGHVNLYFNALSGGGTFAATTAKRSWSVRSIPVRELVHSSVEAVLKNCNYEHSRPDYNLVRARVQRLFDVLDRVVSIDTLHDFDYQEVTNVFVRVNSRGTKLKAAELAIAEVAYRLPELVTSEISRFVDGLAKRGWNFPVAFFIRLIAAEGTGRVAYSGLNLLEDAAIVDSFQRVKAATTTWLDYLQNFLHLIGEDVLAGMNAHIVPITWLARHQVAEVHHRFSYWFALANAFSRYSGTTDTNLDQDLRGIAESDPVAFVDALLPPLRARRASLRIEPLDIERAGQQSALLLLMYLAELSHAKTSLLAEQRRLQLPAPVPDYLVPIQIVSNARLKAVGYGADGSRPRNGGLANVMFVSSRFASGEERGDILTHLKSLGIESRYQHALPAVPGQESAQAMTMFLGARTRLLLDHFNDVLNMLETGELRLRAVADPRPANDATSNHAVMFDGIRQRIYQEIRRRLYDLVPGMQQKETGVYLGFMFQRDNRPFATIAKRKSVLNFTVDAELAELHDPQGWCRDVSATGKHGIGNTSFVVTKTDQVDYALKLLEQVVDLRS